MVLDGEQHKALGVLLQERLLGLKGLVGSDNSLLLLLSLDVHVLLHQLLGLGLLEDVLLVGIAKVKLLDGGLDLERLDGRGSL